MTCNIELTYLRRHSTTIRVFASIQRTKNVIRFVRVCSDCVPVPIVCQRLPCLEGIRNDAANAGTPTTGPTGSKVHRENIITNIVLVLDNMRYIKI